MANIPAAITCTDVMAEKHPELAVTFMKGMIRAGRWANENKRAAAAILDQQTFYRDIEHTYQGIRDVDLVPNLSPLNLASVEIGKNFMLSHGYIKNDFDVQQVGRAGVPRTGGEGTAGRAVEEDNHGQAARRRPSCWRRSGGSGRTAVKDLRLSAEGTRQQKLRSSVKSDFRASRDVRIVSDQVPERPPDRMADVMTGQRPRTREMSMTDNNDTRMQRLGYRTPADVAEPDQLVLVEYVSDGRVAIITLNRPHADNAITTELAAQLIEVLETIAARSSVRVAILTGAGDRAFSVGGDLYQRKNMTKEQWLRQRQVFDRVLYTLRQLRRPIIAAVHGMAYGGGCEIAISTDFIIASDDAVFGQPEAMVGLCAGGGGPVFLPRVLPPGKAMQMLMTGDPITAQEAHRLGMVNELHPRAELMGRCSASRRGSRATRRRRCRRSSGPFKWDRVSLWSRPSRS